jgi:hypothetical protein
MCLIKPALAESATGAEGTTMHNTANAVGSIAIGDCFNLNIIATISVNSIQKHPTTT